MSEVSTFPVPMFSNYSLASHAALHNQTEVIRAHIHPSSLVIILLSVIILTEDQRLHICIFVFVQPWDAT